MNDLRTPISIAITVADYNDVVTIIGTGGTDFVRNVETISLVNPGPTPSTDTLVLHAFDEASLGQLRKIDLGLGRDVIDLSGLASGISITLDQEARYTLISKGGDGTLIVWNANDIVGTNYKDVLKGSHLKANESRVMTDPLVLDLDGDGIELQGLGRRSPSFDIDGDGVAERTAWVGADDGLLARDLDNSGAIEGIGELFGQADQSGFAALSALDSTGDGLIDAADAAFGTLLIWRDADGDAVTDQGELQTLAEAGITSISLATSAPAVAV